MDKMLISNISIKEEQESRMLSAQVDGDEVFFRLPSGFDLFPVAECFVGVALLEAMISGRTLVVQNAAISKSLYDKLNEIQSIYACWNPDLSIVKIEAETTDEVAAYESVGSFFSAGVDSSYSLIRHFNEISHLIIFRAFDYGDEPVFWSTRVKKQEDFARSLGKQLIPVETNAREWTNRRKISFEFAHGLLLSSVGGALGMRKVYVPSSHTYSELFPWGSHPLSDPMWSTETTQVVHDGAGNRRSNKINEILKNRRIADNLQVCWKNIHQNCGECSKCIRTMVVVHLLNGETNSLPNFDDDKMLKVLMPNDENGLSFLLDVMQLAKSAENEKIHRKLRGYYRRYQLGQIPTILDQVLFRNLIRDIYRKLRKPEWRDWRVTMKEGRNRLDQ